MALGLFVFVFQAYGLRDADAVLADFIPQEPRVMPRILAACDLLPSVWRSTLIQQDTLHNGQRCRHKGTACRLNLLVR